jgi:hypothetical protein
MDVLSEAIWDGSNITQSVTLRIIRDYASAVVGWRGSRRVVPVYNCLIGEREHYHRRDKGGSWIDIAKKN